MPGNIFAYILEFLLMGVAIGFCSVVLLHRKLDYKEVAKLAGTTSLLLIVISNFVPQVLPSIYQGMGLVLGGGIVW
jgi:hypothetical protein